MLKVYQDFDMKTYNACKERAEENASTKVQNEATTQAQWEQIYEVAENVDESRGFACNK